jgi:hypothetical protein
MGVGLKQTATTKPNPSETLTTDFTDFTDNNLANVA